MSGIEMAGLFLGAIPLVIEGVKFYVNSGSTLRHYLKYKNILSDLCQELEIEYVIYQNTCEQLLDGLIEDSNEKASLLENPTGNAWKNEILEEKLKKRLARSYCIYMKTMEDMEKDVDEVKKLLKLGPDGKVQLESKSKFRKEGHRIKLSLKKENCDTLVTRIVRNNRRLSKFTKQNLYLETSRSRSTPDYQTIQMYASHVFNLLRSGLQCGCQVSHSVNLRLERRDEWHSLNQASNLPPFRIIVSYSSAWPLPDKTPWDLEALDVLPFADPAENKPAPIPSPLKVKKSVKWATQAAMQTKTSIDPGPDLLHIKNLCQTMQQIRSACMGVCVGFLEDELAKQKLSIFPTSELVKGTNTPSLLSLRTILSENGVGNRRFTRSDKLWVAVLLASSFLQLHQTPWINDKWSKDDIKFVEGVQGDLFEHPFVSRVCADGFSSCAPTAAENRTSRLWNGIRNRPLFLLGILLIELCLGKPFEELRQEISGSGSSDPLSDFVIADQLVEDCYDEGGGRYGDAVRRCIRCDFDRRSMNLEEEESRRAVYNGVVALLEDDWKDFRQITVLRQ
ncbi:hypothetical protein SLS56_001690 [Neofusicoccum ribis]|uniref:DUF7580 domain-containing protein n=1 Tax=Neofusicoccum ribis TaxID=45134 RepID=A0ABR3T807_9PEZI